MMNRTLVFDMDGTIADLYGVENWLCMLRNEDPTPYREAKPLYDMDSLNEILKIFQALGWEIVVTSWLAMGATATYNREVRQAKMEWLKRYDFPFDEIHFVKYGTTKANCTREKGGFQILVDDNEKVRNGWTLGETINAKENIMIALIDLLMKEIQ